VKALGTCTIGVVGARQMITQLARIVLMTAGALGGFGVSGEVAWTIQSELSEGFAIFIFIILGASIGYVFGGIIGRELTVSFRRAEERIRSMETPELMLAAVGLLGGLVVAFLVSSPLLSYIEQPRWLGPLAAVLLYGLGAYGGVGILLLRRRDVVDRWHRTAGGTPEAPEPLKLLDTSAVIDGRFAEVARAGFVAGSFRVPRFVLAELQTLADSADELKRARGKRGLDLLTSLAADENVVTVLDTDYPEIPTVDAKLIRLALASGGSIVTVDYNLTKVARLEGASVLNVNELAEAVRPAFLPGDRLHIAIVKEGKEADQGVGYLEDGTMVVVANAASSVGAEIGVEVTSVLQTSAGRMIFARGLEPS
jgi:uncharacterized protein YacL